MKKVLLVGGTGTISEAVSKQLDLDSNVDLYLMNRSGKKDQLSEKVKYIQADIKMNPDSAKESIQDLHFDSVIHFIVMNLDDAKNSVDIFKGHCNQFIFISTVDALDHRFDCNVNEKMPYGNAYYDYGQNKEACEKYYLEEFKKGFPVTIVRPTQTYSKDRIPLSVKGKSCWSVVQRMLEGKEVIVHGDGQGVWACTHANDFAKLFCPLIANLECVGEIYQVMNPNPVTWDMIYQALADVLQVEYKPVYVSSYLLENSKVYPGMKGSIHGDKHFSCIFDIDKVKHYNPDFIPAIDIHKGMEMYVEFMEAHPEKKAVEPAFDTWCDNTIKLYKELSQKFVSEI